jgi:hypothetical protein
MLATASVKKLRINSYEKDVKCSCVEYTWGDNIKIDLQEVGGGRGDWMKLAQDWDGWRALVGTVRNFRVP